MNKREVYVKALNIITQRKQEAIVVSKMHKKEIDAKIPEISNLQKVLAQSTIEFSKLILARSEDIKDITETMIIHSENVQKQIRTRLVENGYPEDYLDIKYKCTKCNDSGYTRGERCECLNNLVRYITIQNFNESTSMGIKSNFEDFYLKYYSKQDKNRNNLSEYEVMSRILKFCTNYAEGFKKDSSSILMLGGTGLGKTHLSLAIANQVSQKGYTVLYGTAHDFFVKLQNEHFGRGNSGEDTFKTIMEADLFILDDLGAEYESAFITAIFYNIVNSRLNKSKPVIVNTNLQPQEIQKRYGERVASRLMTLYKCLKFVGKDVRQQKLHDT